MKTLFVLEFKKLAKKRMNIIVIAVCLVLVGLLFALPVKQFIVLNTEGEQIMGTAAIAMERDFENAYAGELTNERIHLILRHIKPCLMTPQMSHRIQTQRH